MATDQYGTTVADVVDLSGGVPSVVSAGPTSPENRVDNENLEYSAMSESWDMLHDLIGGTKVMRAASTRWLPKEPKEQPKAYNNRLNRSFLYNAYKNTIGRLVAKPFSKPVTMHGGDLPLQLQPLVDDTDRSGKDLTAFCRELFTAGVIYGLTHVLIDYSVMPTDATIAQERAAGARPVLVHVKPTQLIGWRYDTAPNGQKDLAEIRIREHRTEDKGRYGQVCVDYIRVYGRSTWELWRKAPTDRAFAMISSGTHTFGAVPLKTYYIHQTGMLTAVPPLEDLAWLNVAHWQSLSDQRNILRFARCGILFAAGIAEEELRNMAIGPNNVMSTTNQDAKMSYVEHSGASIKAGKDDLDDLEKRMEILGLQPLIERSGATTATGKIIDEGRTDSDIQSWIRGLETFIQDCFKAAADWIKVPLPEKFSVDVFNDFTLSSKAQADIAALIEMRTSIPPQIDHKTFLEEVKRRGVLGDSVNIDEVIDEVANEGPSLAGLGKSTPVDPSVVPPVVPPVPGVAA